MNSFRLTTVARACALAALTLAVVPRPAFAQLSRVGVSVEAIVGTIGAFRGVDGAYDPRNDAFLMVGGNNAIYGVCVGPNGVPKAAPFTIKGSALPWGAFPRARYSPHIDNGNGGFLVVWVGEAGNTGWGPVHSRVVSCTAGLLGAEQILDPATAYLESAPAIAYSETSQKFLVVWKGGYVTAKLVDNNGTGVGAPALLSTDLAWTQGRDPGVTWNPTNNDFAVSYSGETFAAFALVPASNPTAFVRRTFPVAGSARIYITDIDYNPSSGTYLMTWWENGLVKVAEYDANAVLVNSRLASGTLGSYDALSIAANPLTGTYLLVGVDHPLNGANTDAVIGNELDAHGNPLQAETGISTTVPPARHPRVVASRTTKTWNASWSARTFSALGNQVMQSSSAAGPGTPAPAPGPAPAPPPPCCPPPVPSAPRMNVDVPSNNARVLSTGFTVAGWALDLSAATTTGVDTVHVWAYPASGANPVFVGAASYGTSRPDVGAAFGKSIFNGSGFVLNATLAPGTYDLAVFARSTVAEAFNNTQLVRVTVEAPPSNPRMWVDTPAQNDTLSQNIFVAGWAIDLSAGPNSTGTDAIHVWAYPTTGAAPIFVGAGEMGKSRIDVGNAFGSSRFNNSGFVVKGTLPPGFYTLVVFAHSSVANAFNLVYTISIRVV
jgi:hypothetical protein